MNALLFKDFETQYENMFLTNVAPTKKINISSIKSLIHNQKVNQILDALNVNLLNFDINNIEYVFERIKVLQDKYKLLRYEASSDKVTSQLILNAGGTKAEDKYFNFTIKDAIELEDVLEEGNKIDLNAISIYHSLGQFYDHRCLTKYLQFLKDAGDVDKVEDLNISWSKPSAKKYKVSRKIYRVLESENGTCFLKSINSRQYKEYGIACVFALSVIGIAKLQKVKPNLKVDIIKFGISESEIDIWYELNTIYSNEFCTIQPIIRVKSKDDRENSIQRQFVLLMNTIDGAEEGIELYPTMKNNGKLSFYQYMMHTAPEEQVVKGLTDFDDIFTDAETAMKDIEIFMKTKNFISLKQAITVHISNNRNALSKITEIKNFFNRDAFHAIENLKGLISYCGKIKTLGLSFEHEEKVIAYLSSLLFSKD